MIKLSPKSRVQTRTRAKEFSVKELKSDILREAKILKIPDDVAKMAATRTAEQIQKWIDKRTAVTIEDLNRQAAKELKKYNADLSYVYQIRGTII